MRKSLKISLIVALSLILIAAIVLVCLQIFKTKGQSRDEINVKPSENTEKEAEETTKIEDCSPLESLFILVGNLKKITSYSATVSGEVIVGGLNYTQSVSGEKYISDGKSLYVSRSTSFLKNMAKQLYIENDTALVRNGNPKTEKYDDTVTRYTLDDYFKEYGIDYRELSNYTLNENTITKATLVSANDGVYTYEYEIDVETGVDGYRVNMYKMGDLFSLPTMKKCTLTVSMTSDFMPVAVTQKDEYSVDYVLLEAECVSTLTETFENINDEFIEIPDNEFFTEHLNDN